MRSTKTDRYAFLSDEQWVLVGEVLVSDLLCNRQGLHFVAPSYPEAGQEGTVLFELETSGMNWTGGGRDTALSTAILSDNNDSPDEVKRFRDSLVNTIAVLDAYLARFT